MKRILNRLITDEKGQALPVVLILLVLGGLAIAPLLAHMSTGLNVSRIHEKRMVEQYSCDSAIEHVMWRLIYDSQFVKSMTTEDPSADYLININSMDVPITVTRLSGLGGDMLTLEDVDYVIPAGHLLEFMITVLQDDHCHFAYDTAAHNSWLSIPTTPETTYYLHNNPTPPTGDTDNQENLPMDEVQLTAVNLYNYDDPFWDSNPGRRIEESGGGPGGLELKAYQNWRTTIPYASDTHLQGTVIINLWAAPDGFNYENVGEFRVFLRDYDPETGTYTEIASADFLIEGGQWLEGWTPTAPEGKYKILASAGNTQIETRIALGFGYLRILSFTYSCG